MEVSSIFIKEQIDEAIFWNNEISNYDGIFTHTDIIKVLLRVFKNIFDDNMNGLFIEIFPILL